MYDPSQSEEYMKQRQNEARAMLDQIKEERKGEQLPSASARDLIIGVMGPPEGFQTVDA